MTSITSRPFRNIYENVEIGGAAHAVLGDVNITQVQMKEDLTKSPTMATRAFLKSLSFPELDYRYHSIDPAFTGTCQWFLDHTMFKNWLSNNTCPFLWLRGKPGAGKSTILRMAIDHVKSGTKSKVIGFFFNSRGAALECNLQGFFRSILHQLLAHKTLQLEDEPLVSFLRKWSLFSTWNWTEGELRTMFRRAMREPGLDLILFVDALDECEEKQIRPLVDLLTNELECPGSRLKICVSSRHYPNVSARNCNTIVAEQYNGDDIETYVQDQLSGSNINMTDIAKRITSESSGVFLWTIIVVRKMQEAIEDGESMSSVLQILASLPLDLEEIFQNLLNSINENEREEARLILLFVLFAKRPMTLQDITTAFAFRKQYPSLTTYLESHDAITYDQMSKLITKRTRGLVDVKKTSSNEIVQFIHGSVREYFLQNPTLLLSTATNHTQIEALANTELARACFNFVTVPDCKHYGNDLKIPTYSHLHSLVFYARDYAFQHAREAEELGGIKQSHLGEILGLNNQCPSDWVKLPFAVTEISSKKLSTLSFCSKNNLLSVVQTLPLMDEEFAESDLCQPLCVAAAAGYNDMVALLIEKGAKVDSVDVALGSALYCSVEGGHLETSRLLLQNGASANAPGQYGRALIFSSTKGDEAHVRLLIDFKADVHFTDKKYGNPLLAAASEGHIEIVKILLQQNANLKSRCRYWGGRYARQVTHPLEEASYWGHVTVLSQLLEATVSMNIPQIYFENALVASICGGNDHCGDLIKTAANGRFETNWSDACLSRAKIVSPKQSKHEIEVDVKGFTMAIIQVAIRQNVQGIDLKRAIQDRIGFPPEHQYLVTSRKWNEGGVRKINEDDYLCDRALTPGTRIEVLLSFRACGSCLLKDKKKPNPRSRILGGLVRKKRTYLDEDDDGDDTWFKI